MIRARHRRNRSVVDTPKIELTPMIDVTFLILVFFMCTLKFKTLEQKIVSYLPDDAGLRNTPSILKPVELRIVLKVSAEDRQLPIPKRRVVATRVGGERIVRLASLEQAAEGLQSEEDGALELLRQEIAAVRQSVPDLEGMLQADPDVPHAHVVGMLDLMRRAGLEGVSYAGIPSKLVEGLLGGRIR